MSMIRNLALLGMLLLGASSTVAQEACKRNIEPQGGFSLCVPDGWTASEKEGQKYKFLFAPTAATFTANINMKDEMSASPVEEYATNNADYILKNYMQFGASGVKALTRDSFITKTGLPGFRIAFHTEYKGLLLRTIQYYFNGSLGQKLVLTCTVVEADQVTLDPVCDRAAKTLQLEGKTNPPKEE
jgi:hypothetical protein